ncbi:MAG TPA: hypothetical protein VNB59_04535 [Solirubrobacterales bacterium]|jgi:hypothetical protein|nr:hypothetical protein [Solirubrobacterales bacterium]
MPDPEELQREIERRDEEIARLRDLLLAKEVELGEALGRLREMDDVFRNMMGIAARFPWAMRLTAGGLRRLRRRPGRAGG